MSSDATHLRGVRVARADTGRVVRVLVVLALVGLAILTVILTVSAANQNSRLDQLRNHGVAVTATVTGCLGVGSGVGMGIEYWQCRASYTLEGQQYEAVLGGSRSHLRDGQLVAAVAVPGKPGLLSTVSAVHRNDSALTPYITPIVLGVVTIAGTFGALLWVRRRAR
ncbi:MAG: hypothetical protein J2P57_17505 [Acidimicrobiaceae bacterium]|nr:hypothetical protein [Acidimicrobiaceae bacterium]